MRMLLIKTAIDLGFHVKQRNGKVFVGTQPDAVCFFEVRNLNDLMEIIV